MDAAPLPSPAPARLWPTLLALLPFAAMAAWLAFASDGVYQDDDLAHVQFARWAWHDPLFLLDIWGRPGFTIPYALVANIGSFSTGFLLCRLLSIAVSVASGLFAALCARRLGLRHPAWSAVALLLMPLYFQISYSTLTETICGLYFIAGTYFLLADRPKLAAAILALAPLARFEAVAFFGPVGLYLLWRREWLAILLLTWASVLWNAASHLWMWSLPIEIYLAPKRSGYYGVGGPLHYVVQWAEVVTPAGVGLILAGALTWHRRPAVAAPIAPRPGCAWLVPVGALGTVALHTWIYMRSPYDGGGYPRFLIPACPWMALCAAWAVEQLWAAARGRLADHRGRLVALVVAVIAGALGSAAALWITSGYPTGDQPWLWWGQQVLALWVTVPLIALAGGLVLALRRPWTIGVLGLMLAACVSWNWVWRAAPHHLHPQQQLMKEAVRFVREGAELGPQREIVAYSPWVAYFAEQTHPLIGDKGAARWENGPVGMVFIYDSEHSGRELPPERLARTPHRVWLELNLGNPYYKDPYIRVLEKTGPTAATAPVTGR